MPTLRHCVLGRFTEVATAEQKEKMFDELRGLPSKIPEISSLVCGPDAGLSAGNHSFALNVEFNSDADYQVYATHPDHIKVINEFIKPILAPGSRTAVQFPLPTPLKYYIFGHPVLMSPSPDIHNAGFVRNGFAHCTYERYDTEDAAEVIATIRGAGCGGGSVTIPHKESVMPHMDELTESAQRIGAVNTITKLTDGRLRGDNTDWLGIKNQLLAKAPTAAGGALTGLICGAGGTARAAAFALGKMGLSRVLVYNRTRSRADGLVADFAAVFGATTSFEAIDDLSTLDALERLEFVVDTTPSAAGFTLPTPLLTRLRPTCLEAAYIPRHTPFVVAALAAGCPVVEGVEMLFEQGCAQCEIWTGRSAPRAAIAAALLRELFGDARTHPASEKMEPRDKPPQGLTREVEATGGGGGTQANKRARSE